MKAKARRLPHVESDILSGKLPSSEGCDVGNATGVERERETQQLFAAAFTLHQTGKLDEAASRYRKVLALQPGHFDAVHLLGLTALQKNQPERALEFIGAALRIDPRNASALLNYGSALSRLGRYEAAVTSLSQAIASSPGFADAFFNRANAFRQLKQYEQSVFDYDQAIALKANFIEAYYNRAEVLMTLRRYEEAVGSYDKVIALKPGYAEAYNNRGAALTELKRFDAALASFDRAVALNPRNAEAYNNKGNTLLELERYAEAIECYEKAIACRPDAAASAYNNRGNAHQKLKNYEKALADYEQAIAQQSGFAKAYSNRGVVLRALDQQTAAITSYLKAIGLSDDPEAYVNLGGALLDMAEFEKSARAYEQALERAPQLKNIHGTLLSARQRICDWRDLASLSGQIERHLASGHLASDPLTVMTFTDSGEMQRRAAEHWVKEMAYPQSDVLGPLARPGKHEQIRVGYFSADFRQHAVTTLTAQLFEAHERSGFEWTGFSLGAPKRDAMRERLEGAFDRFIDVGGMSDRQVAELARSLQIDIAVDMSGHTKGCRPGIFALRAAPLQVNYLGYSGTMGAPFMDYLIGDEMVIPAGSERHYREKVIYLPHSYLPRDTTCAPAQREFTREELGLPERGFVYCCFNNSYKIAPLVFDVWMRILRRVEGSVLWFSEGNEAARANLRREAQVRGVDAERLIFATRMQLPAEHLARHRAADLFLDTLPYNAHTTASDALWSGLPVLTRMGEAFASRVAGSLLRALGLEELNTHSEGEYEELAVSLAQQPERLARLLERLAEGRSSGVLFDTPRYARHLESAYRSIYERNQAQLPVDHLRIEP
jgi:predicted O-linked N-acetylglucosamine transferase (SPINDLY family)